MLSLILRTKAPAPESLQQLDPCQLGRQARQMSRQRRRLFPLQLQLRMAAQVPQGLQLHPAQPSRHLLSPRSVTKCSSSTPTPPALNLVAHHPPTARPPPLHPPQVAAVLSSTAQQGARHAPRRRPCSVFRCQKPPPPEFSTSLRRHSGSRTWTRGGSTPLTSGTLRAQFLANHLGHVGVALRPCSLQFASYDSCLAQSPPQFLCGSQTTLAVV